MTATDPKPAPAPLDPRDYEIMCLKFRNEQMHLDCRGGRGMTPKETLWFYSSGALAFAIFCFWLFTL